MTKWTPKYGQISKAGPELENEYDKCGVAVERCGDTVGQLSKGRSRQNRFVFSWWNQWKLLSGWSNGQKSKFGDGEGLQIPCILHFSGEEKFVSKLRDVLPQLM